MPKQKPVPASVSTSHVRVSPHSLQRFIEITSEIMMMARWYYMRALGFSIMAQLMRRQLHSRVRPAFLWKDSQNSLDRL
jgi:hypothetical protein